MSKYLKQILTPIILTVVLILPYFVFSAYDETEPLKKLKQVGSTDGPYYEATEFTVAQIAGTVINTFFTILGVIFIILIILAGYNWMTARGDEEKVTKAKDTITRAIIGLIIVIGAYAIWALILKYIIKSY